MNSFGQDRQEAIHDLVPLFGIDLLGQIHRPFTPAKRTVTCLRSPSRAATKVPVSSSDSTTSSILKEQDLLPYIL